MAAPIGVHLEFRGGAELLFNGVKEQHVTLPTQSTPLPENTLNLPRKEPSKTTVGLSEQKVEWLEVQGGDIRQLLMWIKNNLLKERPELFIQGDSVRPGILVLVNDADWELMGQLDYKLENRDIIVFISTLHGG